MSSHLTLSAGLMPPHPSTPHRKGFDLSLGKIRQIRSVRSIVHPFTLSPASTARHIPSHTTTRDMLASPFLIDASYTAGDPALPRLTLPGVTSVSGLSCPSPPLPGRVSPLWVMCAVLPRHFTLLRLS
ncbi:hypothetical protein E2C01_015945 [Portunus trituberculatus]|uniref:Uncharacterized protein n=1 Tax=Portunus trituberculatus TaxID=210409 RepID=A0A5B7DNX3_PORTR|nr:hypothetical protein [Portunus trituberculatus]